MRNRVENVVEYYVLCNTLKDVVRTGWNCWHAKRERLESIAEHIYGVQMLAIAMWSEFGYDVDLRKVLTMLAVHETEEIFIGDLTPFEISKEEKNKLGHKSVEMMFANVLDAKEIKDLIFEFDERKTKEAYFAYQCDKLECDLQCKLYDEEGCVDLSGQEGNYILENKDVRQLLDKGLSWSEMWISYNQKVQNYDDNFMAVSEYAFNHKIKENGKKECTQKNILGKL